MTDQDQSRVDRGQVGGPDWLAGLVVVVGALLFLALRGATGEDFRAASENITTHNPEPLLFWGVVSILVIGFVLVTNWAEYMRPRDD